MTLLAICAPVVFCLEVIMSISAEVVDFLISLAVGGAAIAALAALWVAALALRQKTQGDQRWEVTPTSSIWPSRC